MWAVCFNCGKGIRTRVFDCPRDAAALVRLAQRAGCQVFWWRLDKQVKTQVRE